MQQVGARDAATLSAVIALGANLPSSAGLPEATLRRAALRIAARVGPVVAASHAYATPCFPPGAGPDFVNGVVVCATTLPPEAVLAELHGIEAAFGRVRSARWAGRSLDLDLIGHGGAVLPDAAGYARWRDLAPEAQAREAPAELILPHPRIADRAFVLVPLAEAMPDWVHPVTGVTARAMCAALDPAAVAAVWRWGVGGPLAIPGEGA